MKKRMLISFCCIIIIAMFLPIVAYADVGPKPSVVINFKGLENESYYVTLLAKENSTGPYSAIGVNGYNEKYRETDDGYEIWKKFGSYKDKDNYYFLQYFQQCSETSEFEWGYHPPQKFKILIYFPKKDSFLVSDEVFERYAFDSYFRATITKLQGSSDNELRITVQKSYDYTNEIISFIARVIGTIIVEIFIALLFGLRKKKILMFIVGMNVITQTILNILLNISNYKGGSQMFVYNYIWMEFLVFVIEASAYYVWFNKFKDKYNIKDWVAPIYALCANVVSFCVGLYIAHLVPRIF